VVTIIGNKTENLAKRRKRAGLCLSILRKQAQGSDQHQKGVCDMFGKIALEEHWESPDFNAAGVHNFTNPEYFEGVQHRLENIDIRIEETWIGMESKPTSCRLPNQVLRASRMQPKL
jgi:hypothetical protein